MDRKGTFPVRSKREWLSEEAAEIVKERRIAKRNKDLEETRKSYADFQRQALKDREEYFSRICKEIEENTGKGDTRHVFKKIKELTGSFSATMCAKMRKGTDRKGTS